MLVIRGLQCKEKRLALSKEWLETNKIGGYAYSTILNINTSEFHSLLTVPDNIKLVPAIIEKFKIKDKNFITNDQNSISFLEKFYIDSHPHFVYNFNGIKTLKSIIMLQYKNAIILKYELISETEKVEIELSPLITGTSVEQPFIIDENFKFQVVTEKEYIKYSREDIQPIYFYFKELTFKEKREVSRNLNEDAHLIGKFEGDLLLNKPVYLILSTERLKISDPEKLYNTEVNNRRILLEKYGIRNELHKNVFFSINSFLIKKREFETIVSGYPSIAEKPYITLLSIPGILFPLKKYEIVKEIFKRYLRKGEIIKDYHNDSPLWFIYAVYKFIQHTGDWKFVKDELWEGIKEIIGGYFSGEFKNIKMDAEGFMEIEEKNDKFLVNGKPVYLNILWYNILRIVEIFSARFTDIDYHTKTQEYSFIIKNKFFHKFWNKEAGYLNNCVDMPPDNSIDTTLRPHQILAISLPFSDLLKYHTKSKILNIIKKKLFTFQGVRTLSPEHTLYNPVDPKNGGLSGFYWGQYITAFLKLNRYSKSAKREAILLIHKFEKNLKEKIIGYLSEYSYGNPPFNPLGEPASSLTLSEYTRILYEELGKF